jgi:hypothetical protein
MKIAIKMRVKKVFLAKFSAKKTRPQSPNIGGKILWVR